MAKRKTAPEDATPVHFVMIVPFCLRCGNRLNVNLEEGRIHKWGNCKDPECPYEGVSMKVPVFPLEVADDL